MPNSAFDQRNAQFLQQWTESGELKPFYNITTPMRPVVEIEGKAPLSEYTRDNGYARIMVPSTHAERPGRLVVNAKGYEVEIINIDLYQDHLPKEVRLTAQVVGNTGGFCRSCDGHSVALRGAGPGADFQRDRDLDRADDRIENLGDQPGMRQQGRARPP